MTLSITDSTINAFPKLTTHKTHITNSKVGKIVNLTVTDTLSVQNTNIDWVSYK